MARKTGQIIRRGPSTWLIRIYIGRDPQTRKRQYIGKSIQGGLRAAQAHLNRMLAERDLGRNIRSSRQTLGQYLDHWLQISAQPRLRAKSFRDYTGLLARYVRPRLGTRPLGELMPAEIQTLYSQLLTRPLSARTVRYTHAVLFSALGQAVRWKLLLSNPAENVDLPRQQRRRFTVFDVEQAKRSKEALDAILGGIDLPADRKSAATRAGGIYHELLEEASEWDADLIVVGSHRPVMADYLLGSNAKTIVRHAQCSVLVVRE